MSQVRIERLVKHFDGTPPTKAIDDIDLEIDEGEFLVLLGPSGCGKTTALRCLAGLERPDQGRITFGDTPVFDAARRVDRPPNRRSIGMVFQSYALWPHMKVRKNIAYPLKARKLKHGLREGWVEQAAAQVDCSALLDRYPAQLSGGQQQRVALARGLVARPDLVLFDEPLSNLDARLRDQVRVEIHELHTKLGFTAVFVTHDQSEALALGDRLAIMKQGKIEQYDTPERVYEHPVSEYVAAFIGISNRLLFDYNDGRWFANGQAVQGASPTRDGAAATAVRVRSEELALAPVGEPPSAERCSLPGVVVDTEYGGSHIDVSVDAGDSRVMARLSTSGSGGWARRLLPGDAVEISFDPCIAKVFPAEVAVA
jgi:iron(III) transport system ATP-binding protein